MSDDKFSNQQGSPPKKKHLSVLVAILFLLLTLSVVGFLYLINNSPTYLIIPLNPPNDQFGTSEWLHTSYTTFLYMEDTPYISPRYYIWRRSTFVSSDQSRHLNTSWINVISYFDKNLSQLGWMRIEKDASCDIFLSEAEFLKVGENGYVEYIPKNQDNIFSQDPYSYDGNIICLAVWNAGFNQDGTPAGFNIVILTSKPSPFTKFFDIFSG